jgi:hypothetical protein
MGIPDSPKAGSNHTLFPSARKERAKPCGIFARKRERAVSTASRLARIVDRWAMRACGRNAPDGRNSGEFAREKRIIALAGADRRSPYPLLGLGAA